MRLEGLWAVYATRPTPLGGEKYRRRPARYICFEAATWRLFHTAFRRRMGRCGTSAGVWTLVPLDRGELLILTVTSYVPSAASKTILETNYGYTGGAGVVIAAQATQGRDRDRMRAGEVNMYFLPVDRQPREIIMALPSDGRSAGRQRWVRLE